ncbi:zonadhesin-like, partial [Triplophysa dalaica]|uniref:zonadhesin-like n=1 Tax=Triplophysa dalaica TaxID=1582913 RepID=UPI0024DF5F8D
LEPHEFASSWNTNDNYWLCSNGSPDPPVCDSDLENAAYTECSALFGDVFTECHWFVPPQIYVTSCITDYCTYQGDTSQLCTSFEDYVSACEVAEVFLTDWRNHTFCDLDPLLPSTNAPKPTSLPESCRWSCNFDQDDCGWEQLIQDSFDWTRWSGSTPSELTGPTGDHTTGNGFYMYIEGDSVLHGDSARMMTPVCYTFEKQCVSFWYHMYGPANVMALNLYLFENNRAVKLWSKTNNQGNRWFQAKVEIKPQAAFQIIVEGIRGSDPRSDVAIDDVVIRYGECEDIPGDDFDTTTLEPPRTSSNSVIPHPVCGLNCDFESDICSWTQLLTDVFDWTRQIGSTPTLKTGPSSDHTTGSGYYIYIEGDSATHGDTARLLSAECTDIQPQCLQFWYHMHGASSTMGLSVYQFEGNLAQEVWRRRDNHGDMWHHALVDLRPTVKFHVIFEGRRGSTALSDVAIDDVSLHRGTCDDLVNQVKPTTPGPLPPTVHTTARPIQTTSASVETTSRPTQTTAEPVHTTTRPVQTTSEPVQTTAEPVQTTTRPVQTTAEPVQTTTRPVQTTAEPVQTSTRPVQTTAEPVQTSTRPVQTTAEPVQTSTRPVQTTAEPVQTSTRPVQTTAAPVQTTTRPVHTTAEPVQTTTRPVQTTAEPVQTTTRPVQTTAEPVQTTTRPVQTTAEPVLTTTRPVQTTAEPVQTTTRPVQTTAEPVQTTTRPVQTTAEPVQTTTRPVQTTAATVQTTTRPVQTTAEPVQTTTRPVQTTAAPVQTTTRPVHTTNESLQTTAGPIQTTASTPSCPINSHYTDCIPACEPTCSHLHGPPNCNTEEPCVQGCVCDDGFVLKQRTCVPISECGCKDSHGNIHSFGEVWYGSHCSQRCECEDDGEIECEDYECDGNEICHVTEQGQHMCQKAAFSKCTIDDDPEYRTFDKMKHKFKGKDSYILVQTTNLPSNIPDVYVVTVNKKVKDKSSEEDSSEEDDDDGRLRAIRIRVYNHTVDFKKGRKIMVDGLSVQAPISPSGGIKIWDRSSRVFLKTDFGLFVEFDGKHKAEITLSHVYKIKIGGLCGNFDAVGKNDMMKPNGEQARNVKEFGESWRVTDRRRQFIL